MIYYLLYNLPLENILLLELRFHKHWMAAKPSTIKASQS